jgi:hypothetical protein
MGTSYIATIRYEQPYITIISRPPHIAQYHIVCIVDHTDQQSLASWLAWHSFFAVSRYYDDFERPVL